LLPGKYSSGGTKINIEKIKIESNIDKKENDMPRPKVGSSRSDLIRLAIAGIDAKIESLNEQKRELAREIPGAVYSAPAAGRPARKRAAMTGATASPAKKKRKVSQATRKKLKEAAKARWARIRAERGE
jgi:hypothetical protein